MDVMPTKTRHGQRAPGNVVMTFPVPISLKSQIAKIAAGDGHTTAEWLRINLRKIVRRHLAAVKGRAA